MPTGTAVAFPTFPEASVTVTFKKVGVLLILIFPIMLYIISELLLYHFGLLNELTSSIRRRFLRIVPQ